MAVSVSQPFYWHNCSASRGMVKANNHFERRNAQWWSHHCPLTTWPTFALFCSPLIFLFCISPSDSFQCQIFQTFRGSNKLHQIEINEGSKILEGNVSVVNSFNNFLQTRYGSNEIPPGHVSNPNHVEIVEIVRDQKDTDQIYTRAARFARE